MTSDLAEVYVWVWLPQRSEPVVAGVVRRMGGFYPFSYGQSYLARPDAVSLGPELPLRRGLQEPGDGLSIAACLRDGLPDGWGQRVIAARLSGSTKISFPLNLDTFTLMLESGSQRFGAIDFQLSPSQYLPRTEVSTLDQLHEAALAIDEHKDLSDDLVTALAHGTSLGGARPKVQIIDGDRHYLAKFSTSADPYPIVKAEALALDLARRCGLDVVDYVLTRSLDRDVLLVQRFDRLRDGSRAMAISGLTMVGLPDQLAGHASYPALLDVLRKLSQQPAGVGRELFARIAFNIAIGNTDDHARNHAAFWDGYHLKLTPAYDLCPQRLLLSSRSQAMAYSRDGRRSSVLSALIKSASVYGLSQPAATAIVDQLVQTINGEWESACEKAELSGGQRRLLWRHSVLNEHIFS